MAPKTRSGALPDAERVFHSNSSPALQQARFPHRRTTIRGYGRRPKNMRRKIADRESSPVEEEEQEEKMKEKVISPKQSTLTQFNWVDRVPVEDEDDLDRPKKRKRRKTEGDAPNSSPPRSTFHTQTLTQRYPELSFSSKDEDPGHVQIDDSEDEKLSLVFGDTEMGDVGQIDGGEDKENEGVNRATRTPSIVPQTPTNKRIRKDVIPSSQDSPLTPMLARYSPVNKRSPLKHKSTNVLAPLPEVLEVQKLPRARNLVIEDSTITKSPTSSAVVVSPGKENRDPEKSDVPTIKAVRFVTPRPSQLMRPPQTQVLGEMSVSEDDSAGEAAERDISPSPVRPRSTPKPAEREIADSDDEFDDLGDSYPAAEDDEYGEVGQETQLLVESLVSSSEKTSSREDVESSTKTHTQASEDSLPPPSAGNPAPLGDTAQLFTSSPRLPTPRPLSQISTQSQTQDHSPEDFSETTPTQARSQPTQAVESQRISLDRIHAMGPQTDRSDIFISIHPKHVEDIVKGTKNHEFRSYRIPNIVTRMWIYVTAPASTLRYMAVISNCKQPGEIEETGLGNAEFNAGKKHNSFAYELQEVYELNNPVPLAEMKEHGWLAGPPQKYNYVPPTVVGHLMANLRCSIFGEEEDDDQAAGSPLLDDLPSELGPIEQHHKSPVSSKYTVSQEVEKQILSEATLQNASDSDVLVPSSSSQERRRIYNATPAAVPPLKLPNKLTPTPFSRLPNPNPSSGTRRSVRLSQATTASQASSPPTSPTKTAPRHSRAPLPPSSLSLPPGDDDSLAQPPSEDFSLDTSQLLTKSQMLPDSVLRDVDPIEDDDEVIYETD
ncbi:hypothetical protein ACHAQA_003094 [Verticillium albo-atrum]